MQSVKVDGCHNVVDAEDDHVHASEELHAAARRRALDRQLRGSGGEVLLQDLERELSDRASQGLPDDLPGLFPLVGIGAIIGATCEPPAWPQ